MRFPKAGKQTAKKPKIEKSPTAPNKAAGPDRADDPLQHCRAEEALRESEEKYRTVVERANDGIIIVQDGIIKYANPRLAELDGSTVEHLEGSPITDHIYPTDVEKVTEMYRRRIAGEEVPATYEAVLKRRDGSQAYAELNVGVIGYQGKAATIVIIRDITDRKRMEKELRKANAELEQRVRERTAELEKQTLLAASERDRLMTLLDSMSDGVWLIDPKGNVVLANRMAKEQAIELKLDPERSRGLDMLSQIEMFALDGRPVGMELLEHALEGESLRELEIGVRNRESDETFYRRLSINRITDKEAHVAGAVVVVQDITREKRTEQERDRLEKQLVQTQKMEAVGTLAGGIAHDFNNMLAVILGNAELALDELTDNEDAVGNIKQIFKAAKRARDLTKQILAFSRKTERGKNPLKLGPLLQETFELLRGTLPTTLRMELDLQSDKDTIIGDGTQIQQVLINLATNAADAMRKSGGVLTLALSDITVHQEGQIRDADLLPGRYVKLMVRDTGPGMTEKVRSRIFEPFFTTKRPGEGTGMGLAVVYGIVKNHGGEITVESRPGRGSVFTAYLPLSASEADHMQEEGGDVPRGKERILVVDDEPAILKMASDTLGRIGYQVTTADNGLEAWELFEKEPTGFDLVITDQVMPKLTGTGLAAKIRKAHHEIPIVLLTGYAETVSSDETRRSGINSFIMKPLTRQEIATTIRAVLHEEKV